MLHYSCFEKDLDDFLEAALLYYGKQNKLDNTPISLSLEKDNDPRLLTSPLKFPGKLAVDVLNNRLFISDSNHNRIVSRLRLPIPNSPLYDHLRLILVNHEYLLQTRYTITRELQKMSITLGVYWN